MENRCWDLDFIDYLITGGATLEDVKERFPCYTKIEFDMASHRINTFCWHVGEDEWQNDEEEMDYNN